MYTRARAHYFRATFGYFVPASEKCSHIGLALEASPKYICTRCVERASFLSLFSARLSQRTSKPQSGPNIFAFSVVVAILAVLFLLHAANHHRLPLSFARSRFFLLFFLSRGFLAFARTELSSSSGIVAYSATVGLINETARTARMRRTSRVVARPSAIRDTASGRES